MSECFRAIPTLAALLGSVLVLSAGAAKAQDAAPLPPTVTVAEPLMIELVEWQEFTGQFSAVDHVEIRARVSGYLQSTEFQDGQFVAAGDLLFVVDPRPFEAVAAAAEAQLSSARARLDLAQQQLLRAQGLLESNNVSQSAFDERVQEARVAQAGVEEAEAALQAAQLELEYTRIAAPVSGRIGREAVSVGNLVVGGAAGNATMLTTIVSLDPIYFEFDMSEQDYLAYQRANANGLLPSHRDGGVRVEAGLFDDREWPYQGRIDYVDNIVDRTSGTIRMRAVFPNPDGFLTPGQFGRLRLPGSPLYPALLLPDEAILSDQDRRIVLTVDAEGIVVPKVVRPGPRELGLRIIRRGLEPTDRVIINGLVRARPGLPVTPELGEIVLPEEPG